MNRALALARLPETLNDWLVLLAIFAAIMAIVFYVQHRRREGLRRVAEELGLAFEPGPLKFALGEDLLALPLLSRQTDLSNLLRGNFGGAEVVLLDCRVGSGRSSITQTLACFPLRGKTLPGFELRPENVLHKIGSAFGYKDIDFEASPKFSGRYLLRGEDEAAIRNLFHPGLLSFFEEQKGWCVEGRGKWLGVYRQGRTVSPKNLRKFLEEASRLCAAFAQ